MRKSNGFSRAARVCQQHQFQSIFRRGLVATDATLIVHALRDSGMTRLGISIPKKVGNAVVRNRWKRLIREAFRLNYAHIPSELVIVVRPRKGAQPELTTLAESLFRLTNKLSRRSLPDLID
ncbi:MAG: ribonuclease P protein component [Pirellulaceae bacterium]|nr:ribonuclease P protein component [Pirellulaceae bacterium]